MPDLPSLPTELLRHILQHLSQHDAGQVRLVSRALDAIAVEQVFHHLHLDVHGDNFCEWLPICATYPIRDRLVHVRSLTFSIEYDDQCWQEAQGGEDGYYDRMDAWFEGEPEAEHKRDVAMEISKIGLYLPLLCQRLEHLTIAVGKDTNVRGQFDRYYYSIVCISDQLLFFYNKQNALVLKSLTFEGLAVNSDDTFIHELAFLKQNQFPRLDQLKLELCHAGNDGEVEYEVDVFDFFANRLDVLLKAIIVRGPGLAHLTLGCDTYWFGFAPKCPKLYKLAFPGLQSLTLQRHTFCTGEQINWINSLSNLKSLTLTSCCFLLSAYTNAYLRDGYADPFRFSNLKFYLDTEDHFHYPDVRWADLYESVGKLSLLEHLDISKPRSDCFPELHDTQLAMSGYALYRGSVGEWTDADHACPFMGLYRPKGKDWTSGWDWMDRLGQLHNTRAAILGRDEGARLNLGRLGQGVESRKSLQDCETCRREALARTPMRFSSTDIANILHRNDRGP